jgi:hypothetical protein
MVNEIIEEQKAETKNNIKKRQRSPAYPSYSLKECAQFVGLLYKKDGIAEIPKEFALQHMGLDPKKNDSYRATSSITGFGLLDEVGSTDKRSFKFTDLGKAIVLLKDDTEQKIAALQEASSKYVIIKQLRFKWPTGLPSNEVVKLELINKGFNERAAGLFTSVLRETYEYARLENRIGFSGNKPPETSIDHEEVVEKSNASEEILDNFEEYTLTLAKGKEIKLFTSGGLTQDDIDFMFEWIKRLGLVK